MSHSPLCHESPRRDKMCVPNNGPLTPLISLPIVLLSDKMCFHRTSFTSDAERDEWLHIPIHDRNNPKFRRLSKLLEHSSLPVSCRDFVSKNQANKKAWEGASHSDYMKSNHTQLQRRMTSTKQ